MTFIRDTQRIREQFKSDLEPRVETKFGLVKAVDGDIYAGDDYHVWVQEIGGDIMPYRVYVPDERPLAEGMGVYFRRDPVNSERWKVIDLSTSPYAQQPDVLATFPSAGIQQHGRSHIINRPAGYIGSDPLDVTDDMLVSFRVSPTNPPSMKVSINPGTYSGATNYEFHRSPFLSEDMTARIPANPGEAKLVAVGLDNTGVLQYTEGAVYSNDAPFVPTTALPAVPIAQELLAIVRLWRDGSGTAMTTITNAEFDQTRRGKAGGGGSSLWTENGGDIYRGTGNVGIGLTAPVEALDMMRDGSNIVFQMTNYYNTGNPLIRGRRAQGSVGTPAAIADGQTMLAVRGEGYGTDDFYNSGQSSVEVDGIPSGNDIPGRHVWYTHALGDTVDSVTERMRLTSEGKLGLGTTTVPHGGIGHALLALDGPNNDGDGPHVQYTVATDDYPVRQDLVWSHDNAAISFDTYWDAVDNRWEIAHSSWMAQIYKLSDSLRIRSGPGGTPGNPGTFADRLYINLPDGYIGIGTSSPQGRLHGYNDISGFLHWMYDGLDGTTRTVIPDGAGDVQYYLGGHYVIRDSAGATNGGTIFVTPTNNQVLLLASGNQFAIFVAADGAVTVRRVVAGTPATTAKVALWLLWI